MTRIWYFVKNLSYDCSTMLIQSCYAVRTCYDEATKLNCSYNIYLFSSIIMTLNGIQYIGKVTLFHCFRGFLSNLKNLTTRLFFSDRIAS